VTTSSPKTADPPEVFGVALRAAAVWVAIIAAETVHGVLRGLLLVPLVGDFPARRIGVPVGSLLVLAVAWPTVRWVGARTTAGLLGVGAFWVALTVLFELALGRLVLGLSWDRLGEDYDPSRGGFLGFGLLFMAACPLIADRLRTRRGWSDLPDSSADR
jgi:hypothetical protein